MVSEEIKWPVTVKSRFDPALSWELDDVRALGNTVEWWNSDIMQDWTPDGDEECVLTDAQGRALGGKIEYCEVVELYVIERD